MGHKSKKSLPQQVYDRLDSMARYGHSKHADKAAGVSASYIYSFATMRTYKKHCLYFVQWCKGHLPAELGRQPRTLAECRPYAERWLREREAAGLSPYTLKMERSALSKLYGEELRVELRGSRRADIKRSRGTAARDAHFSEEKNAGMVAFCRCAGPRRSELEQLDSSALEWHDGRPYVHYTHGTKGGRPRLSPIVGTAEEVAQALAYLAELTGNNRVHSAADVHAYRAEYATRVYEAARAADLEALRGKKLDYTALTGKRRRDGARIEKGALYFCRGDKAGTVMDRRAMIAASRALGHNRESVVGEHYIRI